MPADYSRGSTGSATSPSSSSPARAIRSSMSRATRPRARPATRTRRSSCPAAPTPRTSSRPSRTEGHARAARAPDPVREDLKRLLRPTAGDRAGSVLGGRVRPSADSARRKVNRHSARSVRAKWRLGAPAPPVHRRPGGGACSCGVANPRGARRRAAAGPGPRLRGPTRIAPTALLGGAAGPAVGGAGPVPRPQPRWSVMYIRHHSDSVQPRPSPRLEPHVRQMSPRLHSARRAPRTPRTQPRRGLTYTRCHPGSTRPGSPPVGRVPGARDPGNPTDHRMSAAVAVNWAAATRRTGRTSPRTRPGRSRR